MNKINSEVCAGNFSYTNRMDLNGLFKNVYMTKIEV